MFERAGDRVNPSRICRGPWAPNAMHGGAPFALCGRFVADHGGGADEFHLARLTVELIRPVPIEPLVVEVIETRPGMRIQLLDIVVRTGAGIEVVYGRAMRIRRGDNGIDEHALGMPGPLDVPGPDESAPFQHGAARGQGDFYLDAFEIRSCDGRSFGPLGASAAWFRLGTPVFAGEPISPLDRVLAMADFGNGISNVIPSERHLYINPDVALNLHRLPVGEWLVSDAVTHARADGYGTATAVLGDTSGRVGIANQSLLVAQRP